jgi:hypothetical protein
MGNARLDTLERSFIAGPHHLTITIYGSAINLSAIIRELSNLRGAKIHLARLSKRKMRMGTVFPTILLGACTWSRVIAALVEKLIGSVMEFFHGGDGKDKGLEQRGGFSVRISVIFQVAFVGALDC